MKRIGVTGHQNLPAAFLPQIRKEIERVLEHTPGKITGVTSLAAGTDQLFARAVLDKGGRLHAVIPCAGYESAFTDARALATFQELLSVSSEIEILPHGQPSEQAFLDAGHRVVGIADLMIAVWDGQKSQGLGGTADIVQYARSLSRECVIIWPAGATR
jgi:hypothetical protein